MTSGVSENANVGDAGIRVIPVWDILVRIVHWSVAIAIIANGFFNDAEGSVHEWIGYAVLGLVVLRLVWGVFGGKMARFSAFPPRPFEALRNLLTLLETRRSVHLSHNPLGALMVYNIWLTILAISATGIMMGTVRFFGIDWVEEVHEIAFVWLMVSVGLHVAGVMLDSWLSGVPLVRAMIDGKKRVPESRDIV